MILGQKVVFRRPKDGLAFASTETKGGHTVYAEHERLQGRADTRHVAGGFDDASLETGNVGDLEQWINILQIYLPKPEDMDGLGMTRGEVDG